VVEDFYTVKIVVQSRLPVFFFVFFLNLICFIVVEQFCYCPVKSSLQSHFCEEVRTVSIKYSYILIGASG